MNHSMSHYITFWGSMFSNPNVLICPFYFISGVDDNSNCGNGVCVNFKDYELTREKLFKSEQLVLSAAGIL